MCVMEYKTLMLIYMCFERKNTEDNMSAFGRMW